MELHFSRASLLNSVLRDADGTPVYRIATPSTLPRRVTTIARFTGERWTRGGRSSADAAAGSQGAPGGWKGDERDADVLQLAGMEERVVAEIDWRLVGRSVFTVGGRRVKVQDYMPSKRFWIGRCAHLV